MSPKTSAQMAPEARSLLAWYDRHRRVLPWRAPKGGTADPYRVWLSEIMLQQTTVKTVADYYTRFLERWPRLADLAAAPLEDVLEAWAGLGYYSRARNLHACAKAVAEEHGGAFPEDEAGLKSLPGIGPYTAAAIRSIAFDKPAVVVDGNVERVAARMFKLTETGPALKEASARALVGIAPQKRPGDFAQAMMDLGATICTPKKPICPACPWKDDCGARADGAVDQYPVPKVKKAKPTRRGVLYWVANGAADHVLVRRRPPKGLLGGMLEFPSSPWEEQAVDEAFSRRRIEAYAPFEADWPERSGLVKHTFTHFHLELLIVTGRWKGKWGGEGEFLPIADLHDKALPTLMRKAAALAHDTELPLFRK